MGCVCCVWSKEEGSNVHMIYTLYFAPQTT